MTSNRRNSAVQRCCISELSNLITNYDFSAYRANTNHVGNKLQSKPDICNTEVKFFKSVVRAIAARRAFF
jgi:hypothetical protein